MVRRAKDESKLIKAWDQVADALDTDPMRPVRYAKCFRYLLDLDRSSTIVEVGCGEGTGLLLLREMGFHHLVGLEISAERFGRARSKVGGDVRLILIPPRGAFPLKDQCVDAVVSAAVIEHTIDPHAFVTEVARIVRPGGYIVISSDCFSWRILQILAIYRSIQPIDKALFPTTLFRYFRANGLKHLHYEGFPLPGQEFRFIRLIMRNLFAFPKRILRKVAPTAVKTCVRRFVSHRGVTGYYHQQTEMVLHDNFLHLAEPRHRKLGVISFLELLLSDENVFFLVKK